MKVIKNSKNLENCRCISCPNYSLLCKFKELPTSVNAVLEGIEDQENFEGLFCVFGKSQCISKEKQCNCNLCWVYSEHNLSGNFFCLG